MESKLAPRFESIDGLRGLMVLYVMYHHFALVFQGQMMAGKSVLQVFANSGSLGVRCFFIISGFVILHQMKFRHQLDTRPIQQFYIRRFFRIIPLWWFMILVYALFHKLDLSVIGLNLTFLFGFFMYDRAMMPLPQSWSLFVEEFFYLFFPWIYRNIISFKGALVGLGVSLGLAYLWKTYAPTFGVPTTNYFIEYFPFANLHYFFVGMLIHNLLTTNEVLTQVADLWGKYFRLWWYRPAFVFLYSALFIVYGQQWPFVFMTVLFIGALAKGSWLNKICLWKPVKILGVLSYSAYLLHFLVLELMHTYAFPRGDLAVSFAIFCIGTFGLSVATYLLIEKPFLSLRERFLAVKIPTFSTEINS